MKRLKFQNGAIFLCDNKILLPFGMVANFLYAAYEGCTGGNLRGVGND
jgi:hypothetical protein